MELSEFKITSNQNNLMESSGNFNQMNIKPINNNVEIEYQPEKKILNEVFEKKSNENDFILQDAKLLNESVVMSEIDSLSKSEEKIHQSFINNLYYNKNELALLADNIKFCGPSPDEISLLSASKNICHFFFIGNDNNRVVIQTPHLKFEVEKLFLNEFESERKMMSVLIKYNGKGNILNSYKAC